MTTLITHSGRFHTDEVFGTALLLQIYNIPEITRTRDEKILREAKKNINTIVIDVGREYNPEMNNYDHHQESFGDTFSEEYVIPLSSCGLIWKHFGKEIIRTVVREKLTDDLVEKIYQSMYEKVFLSVDGNDNGIKSIMNMDDVKYNYFYNVTLDEIIGSFNLSDPKNDIEQAYQFNQAVTVCVQYFRNKIRQVSNNIINYEKNLPYFSRVFERDHQKRYLYLDDDSVYYGIYIGDFDREKNVLFFITKKSDYEFKIHTRRVRGGSFEIVAPIISQDDARALVGDDLIFVHKAKFTGACKTLGSAVEVVEESIRRHQNSSFGAELNVALELREPPSLMEIVIFISIVGGLMAWILSGHT